MLTTAGEICLDVGLNLSTIKITDDASEEPDVTMRSQGTDVVSSLTNLSEEIPGCILRIAYYFQLLTDSNHRIFIDCAV